jgi:hypothetical protein
MRLIISILLPVAAWLALFLAPAVYAQDKGFPKADDLDKLLFGDKKEEPKKQEGDKGMPKPDDLDALLAGDKKETKKQEEDNPFARAIKKAKWTWSATAVNFTKRNENQSQRNGDDTKFRQFYTQLLFDTWLELRGYEIKLDAVAQYGSEREQYGGSRIAYPSQVYLKKKIGESDLILGYKYIEDGISTLYAPAKRIEKIDGAHPTDPDKLGVWQGSWTYYHSGNNSTELRMLPYFQKSRIPPPPSRWMAVNGDYNLVGVDLAGAGLGGAQIEDKKIRHRFQDIGWMLKQKMTVENTDFFVSAYAGYLPQPLLRKVSDVKLEKVYIKGGLISGGFATVMGKWEFHGEAVYQIAENRKDDEHLNYVFGAEYDINLWLGIKAIDSAKLTLEYSNEWVTSLHNHPEYPLETKSARLGRNAVYIYQKVDVNDKNKISYAAVYNISKKDNAHRFTYEHKLRDTSNSVEAAYEWFNGADNTHAGRWRENDRFILKFTKKF